MYNKTVEQLLEDFLKPDATDYKDDERVYHKLAWVLKPLAGLAVDKFISIDTAVQYWKALCDSNSRVKRKIYLGIEAEKKHGAPRRIQNDLKVKTLLFL